MNDATVRFGYDSAQLRSGLAADERRLRGFARNAESSFSRLRGVMAGVGFGIFARGALQAVASMDRLRRGMTTLEGSAEAATARLDELRQAAMLPGVDFEQAVKADIKLRSVGVSADLSKRAITEMGNALSLAGGSSADLDGVILALTQIISKGQISAEEINQIAERVPQVRAVMKDAFGTSDSMALQKMGIDAEEFVSRLIDGFSRLDRATAGLDEKIQDFRTNVKLATEAFMDGLVRQGVEGANTLGDTIAANTDKIRDLGSATSAVTTAMVNGFVEAGKGIGDIGTFIKGMWEGMSPEEALNNVVANQDEQIAQKAKEAQLDKEAAEAAKNGADVKVEAEQRKQKALDETMKKEKEARDAARANHMMDIEEKRLRARGQEGKADKLRKERKIAEDAKRYEKEGGMSPEAALALAKENAQLDEDIDRRSKGLGRRTRSRGMSKKGEKLGGGLDEYKKLQEKQENGIGTYNIPGYRRGESTPRYSPGLSPRNNNGLAPTDTGPYRGLGVAGGSAAITAERIMSANQAPAHTIEDLGKKLESIEKVLIEGLDVRS